MRVVIKDIQQIFNSQERECYQQLSRLFSRVAMGQHLLCIEGDPDEIIESDFFLQAVAPMDRVEWEELVRRSLYAIDTLYPETDRMACEADTLFPKAFLSLCVGTKTKQVPWHLTPHHVGEWAEQPLTLFLENTDDWKLFEGFVRAFERDEIQLSLEQKWLKIDGRGGKGEVLKSVQRIQDYERIIIFMDSDRTSSLESASEVANKTEHKCQAQFQPCHISSKREIENYIPDFIIQQYYYLTTFSDPRFQKWNNHSDQEKDFADYKKELFTKNICKIFMENCQKAEPTDMEKFETRVKTEILNFLDLLEKYL
jgi:hypothetical protein